MALNDKQRRAPRKPAAKKAAPRKPKADTDQAAQPKPRKRGRPTAYTREIADTICARLSTGESLRAICKGEEFPAEATVRLWAINDIDGFSARYSRARELGYDSEAERILELADESRIGIKTTSKATGIEAVEADMVERSRLQIEARKWLLAKMLPKRYGEKVTAELTGADGGPIQTEAVGDEELARRVAFILAKGLKAKGK
jgi:hypothetical protein